MAVEPKREQRGRHIVNRGSLDSIFGAAAAAPPAAAAAAADDSPAHSFTPTGDITPSATLKTLLYYEFHAIRRRERSHHGWRATSEKERQKRSPSPSFGSLNAGSRRQRNACRGVSWWPILIQMLRRSFRFRALQLTSTGGGTPRDSGRSTAGLPPPGSCRRCRGWWPGRSSGRLSPTSDCASRPPRTSGAPAVFGFAGPQNE